MASEATPLDFGILKSVTRDISKLVAVPKLPFKPRSSQLPSPPLIAVSPQAIKRQTNGHTSATSGKSANRSPNEGGTKALTDTSEQMKIEYNVYAAPFVPAAVRAINIEHAYIINTKSRLRPNYQLYGEAYFGTTFTLQRPSYDPADIQGIAGLPITRAVSEGSYMRYFTKLFSIERTAKARELASHSLYKVDLDLHSTPHGNFWTLTIPGLREDNPLVEMGDELQIREFWVDDKGDIVLVPHYVPEYQMISPGHEPVNPTYWTGIQHGATVFSVNRAKDIVNLQVDSLNDPSRGPMSNRKKVNVVFTQKVDLLQSQWRALEMISLELIKASSQKRKQSLKPEKQSNVLRIRLEDDSAPLIVPGKGSIPLQNDWSRRMLFPNEVDGVLQTSLRRFPHGSFFDAAINFEQAHAINAVYKNEYGTIPYLISGPPGTGKTKTIVETAMQFLNNTENAHLLICAPSEAATDTLALRLKKYLNTTELLRLNRSARADNEVPGELLQYCYMEDFLFALPPLKALMSYKVVVASCRDATILADARLTNSDLYSVERNVLSTLHPNIPVPELSLHWDALFIDEAAQATEMDILPAISVICPPSDYSGHRPQPRFIMAGDEHQLGPRTASRDPLFSTSLFARLFDRPLYRDHPLARSKVKPSSGPPVLKRSMLPIITPPFTLLIRNYRSHPSILSVPSSLFYHDTLIPEASPDPSLSILLQASSLWRGRKWPVLFLPHNKPDEIERDGGGWYNKSEARLACALAQQLVSESHVDQADICIMAPFAAQVKVLRNLIRSKKYGNGKGLWDVNIGPLEAFQGLEKRVVILCTTRTRERFLELDEKQGLGIVHQARKMNVALTRAMEGLFVIGNPALLGKDEHWREWMAFCWRNGLVDDREGVWKGTEEWIGKGKVGVLERALLAKQSHVEQSGKRALGVSASDDLARDEYEAWTESLRLALEEEEEEEEGEEWDGEEGAEEEWTADDTCEGGINVEDKVHELDGNT